MSSAPDHASLRAAPPPPLPPRSSTPSLTPHNESLDMADAKKKTEDVHRDPRSSSQQSLVPEPGQRHERRTLLLIYIHGFMGNETSFQSFPAHVHNLLSILVAETHVVHSKIYPRYRSKRHITVARDDFGKWLAPHQQDSTDVILLGHSMGGLLAAEVVLEAPLAPETGPLRHRILGTINFDVPFLGMHPGVVKSGLASIFQSGDEPSGAEKKSSKSQTSHSASPAGPAASIPTSPSSQDDNLWSREDPYFNPAFNNDVVLPVRTGWKSALHFITKHSDNLTKATKQLVSSHMEFGGAMANYGELRTRYARLRALEEPSDDIRSSVSRGSGTPPRVRFVNYYTASTGRPKKARSQSSGSKASASNSLHNPQALEDAMDTLTIAQTQSRSDGLDGADAPDTYAAGPAADWQTSSDLPGLPAKPQPLDVSYIQDENVRKLVEGEHAKAVKAYEEAVQKRERYLRNQAVASDTALSKQQPAHGSTDKPRAEMTQKEREERRLAEERRRMEAEGRRLRGENDPEVVRRLVMPPRSDDENTETTSVAGSMDASALTPAASLTETERGDGETSKKPVKDRMFCTLPPKDASGARDPCWVRVFMEGVDEVGAHCGLFFVDERYERLVGDVAERAEAWVKEALSEQRAHEEFWACD